MCVARSPGGLQGIVYMFVSNSDNLGATLDLALLDYFAKSDKCAPTPLHTHSLCKRVWLAATSGAVAGVCIIMGCRELGSMAAIQLIGGRGGTPSHMAVREPVNRADSIVPRFMWTGADTRTHTILWCLRRCGGRGARSGSPGVEKCTFALVPWMEEAAVAKVMRCLLSSLSDRCAGPSSWRSQSAQRRTRRAAIWPSANLTASCCFARAPRYAPSLVLIA